MEKNLSKDLIEEYGFSDTVKILRQYFKTFNARIKNRDAVPSFGLFYSLRGILKAEIDGVIKEPKSREEKVKRADFNGNDDDLKNGWDDIKEKEYSDDDLKNGW